MDAGLWLSLRLTLKLLNDNGVYLFFNLLSYFPAGFMAEDIEKLWPKVNNAKKAHSDWRLYMTFLMKASLVTKKRVKLSKKDHEVYLLVPMLKQMAEENITLRESDLVHRSITQHYVTILWDILRENSLEANKGK
jgi:hypothetical protein